MNVFKSFEAHCWSMDCSHEQYLEMHKYASQETGTPLVKEAYELFCKALQIHLEADLAQTHPF